MVGVPKSKGCSTCRARSVKCDEARPNCYQCRRGGRKCPGYKRDLKFVDENPKFKGKVDGKKRQTSASKSPMISTQAIQGTISARQDSPISRDDSIEQIELLSRQLDDQISCATLSKSDMRSPELLKLGYHPSSRNLEQQGIVASFVQDLFPVGRSTVQLSFIGSWLWHVPQVLQKNNAMDLAAESLALVYYAKKANSSETFMRSRWVYTNALRALSRALQDNCSRFASETLCATLLLVHYESFVAMPGKSWITHAGGAGRLIRLRGPERHRSGFDCAMFMASRGYLISEAVVTKERCFLGDNEWRRMQIDNISFPLMPKNCAIYHEGLNHFAIIPGLLKNFRHLSTVDFSNRPAGVYSKLKEVYSSLMDWYHKLQSEFEQPIRIMLPVSPTAFTIFPSVYEYRDIITATFVVNYSAYLLQINSLLDVLECSDTRREENMTLSRDICMSATYLSRAGFCGNQAMAFALPFALSALPESYAGWIQHELEVFKNSQQSATLRSTMLDESRPIQSQSLPLGQ